MKGFCGIIKCENGYITSIEPQENGLTIISDGEKYELPYCAAYPAFVDSHCHFTGTGMRLMQTNLSNARSAAECARLISQNPSFRGDWIEAWGWNQEQWTDKQFPHKYVLDEIFPNTPVIASRIDGHSIWANSKALEIAGININTENPQGGTIIRDDNSEATGLLIDNAMKLVTDLLPDYSFEQNANFMRAAQSSNLRNGIAEVADMDVAAEYFPIFADLIKNKLLKMRINAYTKAQHNEYISAGLFPFRSEKLSLLGLKFFADGALGSKGAALLDSYLGDPDNSGLDLIDTHSLFMKAKRGILSGFDIAVHAIGDRANRNVIEVFRQLRADSLVKNKGVLRLEHAQILTDQDADLAQSVGAIMSIQPIHYSGDICGMFQSRIKEEDYSKAYRWRSLSDMGFALVSGSDCPIESNSALMGIQALVTRKSNDGKYVIGADEALDVQTAIDTYCKFPHIATGNSKDRGSIELYKCADLVILNGKIEEQMPEEIASLGIVATFCSGEPVFVS